MDVAMVTGIMCCMKETAGIYKKLLLGVGSITFLEEYIRRGPVDSVTFMARVLNLRILCFKCIAHYYLGVATIMEG